MPDPAIVIEVVGEGKTDRGRGSDRAEPPTTGVVPVLVHRLCDRPDSMRVLRRPPPFLQGKRLWQKVRFAKRQASGLGSAGLVYVLDTEGGHPSVLRELQRGRDFETPEYPTVVGVAHPCIEAWLLSDAAAIARAFRLSPPPEVPEQPESLAAPCRDRSENPKSLLGRRAGLNQPLSAAEATRVAHEIRNLDAIRHKCPTSFAPFADEIVKIIKPLFRLGESVGLD